MGVYKTKSVYKTPGVYRSGVYKSGVYKSDSEDTVTIGGKSYKTVKIGDQVWLAENLDFVFEGLTVGVPGGSADEPRANYYNDDEATYGWSGLKYGLLYNWIAVKYIEDHKSELIPGWHVPTVSEWSALATAVGGSSVAGTKLKSTTGWSSGNGDGSYGFAAFPAGRKLSSSFNNLGSYAYFWTATEYSSSNAYYRYFDTGASMNSQGSNKSNGYSVRLVKDSPMLLLGAPPLGSSNVEAADATLDYSGE